MIQDPNPNEDVVFERFIDWISEWRNNPQAPAFYAMLPEKDLRRIWLEGLAMWHRAQLSNVCPPTYYQHHSDALKNILTELGEQIEDFIPTSLIGR